ncbi:unnamed protein product [Didymodactylos carnosus]|uniref:Tetratricopeptide repeat protein n=1 Tax=Didymodactylos carnosus TaxID=1234261 RepID=A0A814DTD0_9BILA|nr:unnamed protein product [Didymodactylos carnosus]CAF1065965.1 unnamed protein product [Didymodactylos carnosus]CAF3734738.1 unnamed protein product [Didymodactylos carnosus]CAF3831000.1 unnamed protein product [Didymodactylos carnosus]
MNIGMIHFEIDNFDLALVYFEKIIELQFIQDAGSDLQDILKHNPDLISDQDRESPSGLKAGMIFNPYLLADGYHNIGNVYVKKDNLDLALQYYKKST